MRTCEPKMDTRNLLNRSQQKTFHGDCIEHIAGPVGPAPQIRTHSLRVLHPTEIFSKRRKIYAIWSEARVSSFRNFGSKEGLVEWEEMNPSAYRASRPLNGILPLTTSMQLETYPGDLHRLPLNTTCCPLHFVAVHCITSFHTIYNRERMKWHLSAVKGN